jgi:HAD domain in Swiss Army Knife RNA repair proteins
MNFRKGILFLDCDGVINSGHWFKSEEYEKRREAFRNLVFRSGEETLSHKEHLRQTYIDPRSLAILNDLLIRADLSIVLSSTWRKIDFTRDAIAECGIDNYTQRFLGCTGGRSDGIRGLEIKEWIDENNYKGKFAILDDDCDMDILSPFLFQTSWMYGLTKDVAEKIVQYFK